ncbi:MAG: cobalt transporter CbiM [Chloroflexaceae bacterium]|nr:cobalt transporter CbiM [Chloroflexaceae bacterium]
MHIADGILPLEVCAGGYGAAAALTGLALHRIGQTEHTRERIPRASLLSAAFFVASWVHLPLPPASVHLVLNGLLGAVLGFYAVPAIVVALFFQAVMFGHGGLTTLGVNAVIMGGPALLAHLLFRLGLAVGRGSRAWVGAAGFVAGLSGVGLAVLLFAVVLVTTIPASIDPVKEQAAIMTLVLAHIPLMVLEGIVTAMVVLFLWRVRPELLTGEPGRWGTPVPGATIHGGQPAAGDE